MTTTPPTPFEVHGSGAGLHGTRARHEVSERASAIMDAGLQLLQDQDKLTAMMEAAQVVHNLVIAVEIKLAWKVGKIATMLSTSAPKS